MLTDKEIAQQKLKDSRMLDLLRVCKSDIEQPHILEHFFYAPDSATANAMVDEAHQAGYTASDNHYIYEGKDVWSVMIFTPVTPDENGVNSESIFMLSLARKHGANYDGWGTMMTGDHVSLEHLEE